MKAPDMPTEKKVTPASYVPDPTVMRRLDAVATISLIAAAMIAAIVLCGWLVPAIGTALPRGWSVMKANTALAVLLCSASLVLTRPPGNWRRALAGRACASVAVLLAAVALFEHGTGWSTGLDTLLAADAGTPGAGRMAIQTAFCFILLGSSLLIERTRQDLLGQVLDLLLMVLVMLILVLVAGYLFGAPNLVGQTSSIRTSPQTLVCITLLTFVQTSHRAAYGSFSVLVGVGIGSQFARIALPTSVALSYLTVGAGESLLRSGTLTLPYAAAVTASALAGLLFVLVVLLAGKINDLEARLRGMSLSDELTGFHNRRGFYVLGEQAVRDARRAGRPLTVLFLDVDGLKKINDNFGHDVGSQLLLDVATTLRATFRDSDVIGRIGGDEFAIITMNSEAELAPVLQRLDEAIEAANAAGGKSYRIGLSIGGVTSEAQSGKTLAELLTLADTAMYEQKRRRRTEPGAPVVAPQAVAIDAPLRMPRRAV